MSRITLDTQLRSKLNGLNEQVELCDESGQTVGQFLPQKLYLDLMYAWAKEQFKDDDDTMRAREELRSNGGMTTAEAIAYLRYTKS